MEQYTFKTINIKGKEYVTINERVKAFRTLTEFKNWTINTNVLQLDENNCVFRCEILDENGRLRASGTAQEDRNSTMINKTSYVENCETSAVGRALGMLGIGIENSIATADEVRRAISQQEAIEKSAPKARKTATTATEQPDEPSEFIMDKFDKIVSIFKERNGEFKFYCQKLGKEYKTFDELSAPEIERIYKHLVARKLISE